MIRTAFPLLIALYASSLGAQTTAEHALSNFTASMQQQCGGLGVRGEVIVCGRRSDTERYRVPLMEATSSGRVAGDVPRATTDVSPPGRCGMFQGQRQSCTRAEMEESGFYRGRDPVSAATRAITGSLDPD